MRNRKDYRSGTKQMTDEQIKAQISYHQKWMDNDEMNRASTTHLTKYAHFMNEAKLRKLLI